MPIFCAAQTGNFAQVRFTTVSSNRAESVGMMRVSHNQGKGKAMSGKTLEVNQFAELIISVVRQLPRDIDSTTAQGWIENQQALAKVLRAGLMPDVKQGEHLIDCDANPSIPDGWSVEEHRKAGMVKWDTTKQTSALYLSKLQKKGKYSVGNDLRKELANKPVLNACVLDYLLKNPHLIPEEWKGKAVFFWGTIYRVPIGSLCVRYLYWCGDRWDSNFRWLVNYFSSSYPAALLAS